ncbi:MAG TPA: hypothetical protein VF517_05160 [Thermoleophilaceae bacterium]|jgi:hypothetical protein
MRERLLGLPRWRIALDVAICGLFAGLLTLGLGALGDAELDAVARDALAVGIAAALFYAFAVYRVRRGL